MRIINAKVITMEGPVYEPGYVAFEDGKITGDVLFLEMMDKAGYITPVPGGVGPMTIAMLLWNVVRAAQGQFSDSKELVVLP